MASPLARYGVIYGTRLTVLIVGFWLLGLFTLLIYSFYFFCRELRGARAVADIATSRMVSAAQGYSEIIGRGSRADCILAPLSGKACLWYSFYQYEKKGKDWKLVDKGVSEQLFVIREGEAKCYIDPHKAQMSDLDYKVWRKGIYRCHELLLLPDRNTYVLGNFSTESLEQVNTKLRRAVGERIAEWKESKQDLYRRFDLDSDGNISDKEMMLMRAQAQRELRNEDEDIDRPINVMRAPADGRPFIISHHSNDKLVRRYQWHCLFYLVVFIGVTTFVATKPVYGVFAGGLFSDMAKRQYFEWQKQQAGYPPRTP
jgi:hypothetical protein